MQGQHNNIFDHYPVNFKINGLLCSYGVICLP